MAGLRPKDRARLAVERLAAIYPAASELEHRNAFQMLIATILSAQTTDRSVNSVTPALFSRYPDAAALAHADPQAVEALIKPTGVFHVKAKTIVACSTALVERFGGEGPGQTAAPQDAAPRRRRVAAWPRNAPQAPPPPKGPPLVRHRHAPGASPLSSVGC